MELKCRIKDLRYEKRMTQVQLYEKTGIAINLISAYENDSRHPNLYSLWKLAKALDCDILDLYQEIK